MSAARLLLIDNYDSFTYNLYQYLCELGASVSVVRNDEIRVEEVQARGRRRIAHLRPLLDLAMEGPAGDSQPEVRTNLEPFLRPFRFLRFFGVTQSSCRSNATGRTRGPLAVVPPYGAVPAVTTRTPGATALIAA